MKLLHEEAGNSSRRRVRASRQRFASESLRKLMISAVAVDRQAYERCHLRMTDANSSQSLQKRRSD
jgi:hypothetical protein